VRHDRVAVRYSVDRIGERRSEQITTVSDKAGVKCGSAI
jgi:hypothetical protein